MSFREEAGFKTTFQLLSLSHLTFSPFLLKSCVGGQGHTHTHTHTVKQVSMKPFSKGARISIPEPELALSPRRTNSPNVTTSAQLIDLDWNTFSPVNGLYLSGSTKKSEMH